MILPPEAHSLLLALAPAFTTPTFQRFITLMAAAILTPGRRTVANLLRTAKPFAQGHPTTFQRVFSSARWSALRLAACLVRFVLRVCPLSDPILLVGDDTVDGHKGKKVWGKARHRDAVRSSHSYTAWRYGHRWVVLSVLVRFPFTQRHWALPVLVDLYLSAELNQLRGRPHRTPAQLMCRLLRLMLWWFPRRRFVFIGDSGYGSHEVARFVYRHRQQLSLVSKFHPQANLYESPPPYQGQGRPRVKGKALAKPSEVVGQKRKRRRLRVDWYGGGTRQVAVVSGKGQWYKSGQGLVPVLWVFVEDRSGTHREEYFFTTDLSLSLVALISRYTSRWNIETTFQEMRAHLGLETTRGWCRQTVLRVAPCLFGLYTAVALLYQQLPVCKRAGAVWWPGKSSVTFSDALTAVRRWLWTEWVFPQVDENAAIQKLPDELREMLLTTLAPAA